MNIHRNDFESHIHTHNNASSNIFYLSFQFCVEFHGYISTANVVSGEHDSVCLKPKGRYFIILQIVNALSDSRQLQLLSKPFSVQELDLYLV